MRRVKVPLWAADGPAVRLPLKQGKTDHALQDTSGYLCACVCASTHVRPWVVSVPWWMADVPSVTHTYLKGGIIINWSTFPPPTPVCVIWAVFCWSDRWLFSSLSPRISITPGSLWLCGHPGHNTDRFKSLLSTSPGFTSLLNPFLASSGELLCVCNMDMKITYWQISVAQVMTLAQCLTFEVACS